MAARSRPPFCSAEVGRRARVHLVAASGSALFGAWAKALGLSQFLSCNTSAFSPLLISPVEENNINMCVLVCVHLRRLCVVFPYSEVMLVSFYSSSTPSKRIKYWYL